MATPSPVPTVVVPSSVCLGALYFASPGPSWKFAPNALAWEGPAQKPELVAHPKTQNSAPPIPGAPLEPALPCWEAGHFLGDKRLCIERGLLEATLLGCDFSLGAWSGTWSAGGRRGTSGPSCAQQGQATPHALCSASTKSAHEGLSLFLFICAGS